MIQRTSILLIILLALAGCAGLGGPSEGRGGLSAAQGDVLPTIAPESRLLDTARDLPRAGEMAPDFEFTLADGTRTRLSDLQGQKVILNFWATWCFPCREEMPDLQAISEQHGESVVVIGINKGEGLAAIQTFVEEVPVSFPLVADSDQSISARYGARNLPTSYFINTDGTIGAVDNNGVPTDFKLGIMNYRFIERQIERLN